MPTYVYRNLSTGDTFELKQSMKDAALTQHPETGEPVKRLVSAPAIAFKGSGFYATDSRSSKSAVKTADTTKTDSSKTESAPATSEGKSESKTAESKAPSASTPAAPSTPSSSGGSGE